MPHSDRPARIPSHEGIRHGVSIKVVSVGGGGNNAINRMIALGMEGVEFISINTDLQSLRSSKAKFRLQIGARVTHGLGTGSDPELGRRAALDESDKIAEALEGADMVFITAGLGGGTGTGVAPVVASTAMRMGALTVAIVTLPFAFEGKRRMNQAERGLQDLLDQVDTLIVIPNDRLLASAKDMGFFESFQIADDVLRQAVQGISDIITVPGVINRDFADVRTTIAGMGYGVMGTANRSGPHRATEAALAAIASPLLAPGAVKGARGILINIAGSSSLRLSEVHQASTIIQSAAHEDANITFGAVLDERLGGEMKVTVIATGFDRESRDRVQQRSLLRRTAEKPACSFASEPRTELDAEVPAISLIVQHPEGDRSKPTTTGGWAEKDQEASLPAVLQHPLAERTELRPIRHMRQGSYASESISPPGSDVAGGTLEASPPQFAESPYEEDLLTILEGLPFDVKPTAIEIQSSAELEAPLQPEIFRGRQAAIAAYAANSTSEIISPTSVTHQDASFAEVLESRQQMHGIVETESDYQPEEAMPESNLAASADSPIIHNTDTTYVVEAGLSSSAPATTQVARTKTPTPDFNRRLNREPEFSMGVEVI